MNIKISLPVMVFLLGFVQADEVSTLAPLPKSDQLLSEQSMPDACAIEVSGSEDVLIENMRGVLLLGNLDRVEKNPNIDGVVLKDLTLPGSEIALIDKLNRMVVGQPLTQQRISEVKREITLFYQENDRPVVAVVVPEQDVTDGVLQVGVIEGKLGKVTTQGGKWFKGDFIKSKFHLTEGEAINTDELLTDLSWVNQNPFRQSNLVFTPGSLPGSTDIEIVTNDRLPWRFYIGGDNTGNHFTGRNRWYAGANWGNVFGLDQVLSVQYTTSSDFDKFKGITANYTIPLPWQNTLMFYGGYSWVNPDIRDHHRRHFKSHGWSGQISARYIIPVGKTYGNFLQNCQAGYDYKATNNSLEFNGSEIETNTAHVNQFLASYYMGWTPRRHKINADLDIFFSPGNWFGDENKKAFERLQRGAETSYIYARGALGDEFSFTDWNMEIWALGRAQLSSATLVPSEQFGLGGYDTVRGYEQRVVNYDNAVCINFEFRAPPISLFKWFGAKEREDQLIFLGFVDYGYGWPHDEKGRDSHEHLDPKNQTLVGVGPGLRYKLGSWFYARVDYGFPLTNVNDKGKSPVLDFGILCSY